MWKRIRRFFSRLFKKPVDVPRLPSSQDGLRRKPTRPDPITEKQRIRVALIVGHTRASQGARSYNGHYEYSWNMTVADLVIRELKRYPHVDVELFNRSEDLSYRSAVKQVAKAVKSWGGADVSLELHFNSVGHKKNAYGCEILIAGDSDHVEETAKIADYWTDKLAERFGLKERHQYFFKGGMVGDGVKVLDYGERGYWNIAYQNDYGVKHAMLIEPMFAGTRTEESQAFFENHGMERYAQLLAELIGQLK